MAELNVILSADGKQLTVTMKKAEKDVEGLEHELKDLPKAFAGVDKALGKTASGLKGAAASTEKFTRGIKLSEEALKKLPAHSDRSSQALLNLGRVAQDAPFGILGIANNINPLLESFQRLQKETGSTKTALKSLVSGLTGAGGLGLAVSVISSLMIVFADKLFGAKEASKASEEALRSFGDALESVKDGVKALSDELQFANQLGGINVKIRSGGKDVIGTEVQDLKEQSVAQAEHTVKLQSQRDKLKVIGDQITANTQLSAKDRIEAELKYFNALKDIDRDIVKSQQDQTIIYRRIALQRIEDVDAQRKKDLKLSDKYFADLIKRVRSFEKFINEHTIRFANFDIEPDEPRVDTIKRALEFIDNAINKRRETFDLKIQEITIHPASLRIKKSQEFFLSQRAVATQLFNDLQEEMNKLTSKNKILIKATTGLEKEKARGAEFFGALGIASADENAPKGLLTDAQKAAVNLASVMNQTVVPAFDNLFNAIKAGENPIKAFFQGLGQAIQQLIQKLLQAVLQAALLSAITGGATSFGGAFKSLLGFKAEGGPVFSGKPYVVGEKGPELFIPQGGGRIIPNNEMNSGLSGITGGMQAIRLSATIRNRDILLGNARESRSQNRNG